MGKWRYGVILDAGSSGTRVHIYKWLASDYAREDADADERENLPHLKTKKDWTLKVHPGISTYGENPMQVGSEYLAPLYAHALDIVPSEEVARTPVFLLATAGMRLLPDLERNRLLEEICDYTQRNTKFHLPDCDLHVQVISGETEGLYGWIAANYLLGGFDHPEQHNHGKGHNTYGFLDMGGASAQIAFAPNATEAEKHANDLKLLRLRTIMGAQREYRVFVTTWLGFGVNEARKRYIDALLNAVDTALARELPDPCLPAGLTSTLEGTAITSGSVDLDSGEPYLVGTGQFDECLRQTNPLLEKNAPCDDPPCLVQGVHVPAIDFDVNHFVGVSEYWHTTYQLFEEQYKDKSYDFNTYQHRISEFCSQDWPTILEGVGDRKWGKKVDEETALQVCFKASWIINMLHEGIGIPRAGLESTGSSASNGTKDVLTAAKEEGYLDPFHAVNKIDDTEVSWTLGKMVLYASSLVPPVDQSTLAVGFGSNVPGIPWDFQYAGGRPSNSSIHSSTPSTPYISGDTSAKLDDATNDNPLESNWTETVLSRPNLTRRGPGFMLITIIFVVIFILLCGRERRANFLRRCCGGAGGGGSSSRPSRARRPGPVLGGLFHRRGDSGGKHDRSAEEGLLQPNGDGTLHLDHFELGGMDDSSDAETTSLSDGNIRRNLSARNLNGGGSFTLGPSSVFERGGLTVRNESRDRLERIALGVASAGPRSRTGSPSRWRSPLMAPLKEV